MYKIENIKLNFDNNLENLKIVLSSYKNPLNL